MSTQQTGVPIEQRVSAALRDVPDFPAPGVMFKDLMPVFANGPVFAGLVADIAGRYAGRVDGVVGIEARGFILGAPVANALGLGFVAVRKAGKLPGETVRASYTLEYGSAEIEVHSDAFPGGERVLVLDDVLATGGTAAAACELVERAGARVVGLEMVVELEALGGRARLGRWPLHTMLRV